MIEINDDEFALLKEYLLKTWGMDISSEKKYLFHTRLAGFLKSEGCLTFGEFYRKIKAPNSIMLNKRLVEAMTTNETSFFRDGHPYDALMNDILPVLIKRKQEEAFYMPPRIRIWSAGCSHGHEPYSIAMTIHKWLADHKSELTTDNFLVLGTDISNRVINRAKAGVYSAKELGRWIPGYIRKAYFEEADNDELRIIPEIKNMVRFDELNLAEPFEKMGFFDLILCRNVIIYFSFSLKQKIITQFYNMLNPGGALMLGSSETLYMLSDEFKAVHKGQTIYYLKP